MHDAVYRTLSVSSAWLILPAAASPNITFTALACATCAISMYTWSTVAQTGARRMVFWDRCISRGMFAMAVYESPRAVHWPLCCAALYLTSRKSESWFGRTSMQSLCVHLLFRYVGFWWTFVVFAGSPSALTAVSCSVFYFASCSHVYRAVEVPLHEWNAIIATCGILFLMSHPLLRLEGTATGYYAGHPLWRSAWALYAQLGAFPYLTWLAHHRNRAWARIFMYVFFVWVLADFVFVPTMSTSMMIHHIFCACGTAVAMRVPDAALHFVQGSVVLELGSAATNIACIYPAVLPILPVFIGCTHAIALVCTLKWCGQTTNWVTSAFALVGIASLCLMRQMAACVSYAQ